LAVSGALGTQTISDPISLKSLYVIDHVKALKHGDTGDPSNMQWQTVAEAKAKNRTE